MDHWNDIFGEAPASFTDRVRSTLAGLEEPSMEHNTRKTLRPTGRTLLIAVIAATLLIGGAVAAGVAYVAGWNLTPAEPQTSEEVRERLSGITYYDQFGNEDERRREYTIAFEAGKKRLEIMLNLSAYPFEEDTLARLAEIAETGNDYSSMYYPGDHGNMYYPSVAAAEEDLGIRFVTIRENDGGDRGYYARFDRVQPRDPINIFSSFGHDAEGNRCGMNFNALWSDYYADSMISTWVDGTSEEGVGSLHLSPLAADYFSEVEEYHIESLDVDAQLVYRWYEQLDGDQHPGGAIARDVSVWFIRDNLDYSIAIRFSDADGNPTLEDETQALARAKEILEKYS